MRILLIGKGGREHALAWKLRQSKLVAALFLWPGNAAMASLGEFLDLPADAPFAQLIPLLRRLRIDMVISGPEAPLAAGLADVLEAAGIPVFGPKRAAAMLEASKAFAKEIMQQAQIPTAAFKLVHDEAGCRVEALAFLAAHGGVVLKASGLASGKGVFVCRSTDDVEVALKHLYHTEMRAAASTVVLEELLTGRECSYFTFLGQGGPTGLGFAVDYKRLGDGDRGPNTGGMGCYAPVPWLPLDAEAQIVTRVVEPLLQCLKTRGIEYRGCLYVGIMWSEAQGPQVVEFNVRLGDPEAEVLAAYDTRDWVAVMAAKCGLAVAPDALAKATALPPARHAVAVVMTGKSYPFGVDTEAPSVLPKALFSGPEPSGPVWVLAASVHPSAERPDAVTTSNGRVLVVTAEAESFAAARQLAYAKVDAIARLWPNAHWRRDIAADVSTDASAGNAAAVRRTVKGKTL